MTRLYGSGSNDSRLKRAINANWLRVAPAHLLGVSDRTLPVVNFDGPASESGQSEFGTFTAVQTRCSSSRNCGSENPDANSESRQDGGEAGMRGATTESDDSATSREIARTRSAAGQGRPNSGCQPGTWLRESRFWSLRQAARSAAGPPRGIGPGARDRISHLPTRAP